MMLQPSQQYSNQFGQVVQVYKTPYQHPRPIGTIPMLLFIHTTEGIDTRQYFLQNDRTVSSHYLIGEYANIPDIQVLKYASEQLAVTYTQGWGILGGHPSNLNNEGISIEIEGPPVSTRLLVGAATLAADIIARNYVKGTAMEVFTHRSVDPAKKDPSIDWVLFNSLMYGKVKEALFTQRGS